ncbi:hypothetical protein HY408_00970 [Candidatus Gottesmanbacteria bacterium]|nr:hypothetical protein [Candidatus Gottesmanbacteria bacterium]
MSERLRLGKFIHHKRITLNEWVKRFRGETQVIPQVQEPISRPLPATAQFQKEEPVQDGVNDWRSEAAQQLQGILTVYIRQGLRAESIKKTIGDFALFDVVRETPEFTPALSQLKPVEPETVTPLLDIVQEKPPRTALRQLKLTLERLDRQDSKPHPVRKVRSNGPKPSAERAKVIETRYTEKPTPRPVALRSETKNIPIAPDKFIEQILQRLAKANIHLKPREIQQLLQKLEQLRVLPEHKFLPAVVKHRVKGGQYKGYYVLHIGRHGRFPVTIENGTLYIIIAEHEKAYGGHQIFS